MTISNFYEGTTKFFTVTITVDEQVPDIRADTVTFMCKRPDKPDSEAVIEEDADVTTEGEMGVAIFDLTPVMTAVPPASYNYEILWTRSSGEVYVLKLGSIKILERVSDV